ncbi:MAG TPA: hypothetical protein PKK40_01130, partial [Marmoricola sp.]|nr:hypothetical protein [Marmoricola sp.]
VEFDRVSGFSPNAAEYYNDVAEGSGSGSADLVTVGAGEVVDGIDSVHQAGGSITGNINRFCSFTAFTPDGSLVGRQGSTDGETFSVPGVGTGQYYLRAEAGRSDLEGYCNDGPRYYSDTAPGHLTNLPSKATPISTTRAESIDIGTLVYSSRALMTNVTPPTISGTPAVGHVLRTTRGEWSTNPDITRITWLADGQPVAGNSSETLTLTSDLIGKKISSRVLALAEGFHRASAASASSDPVAEAGVHNTGLPQISGEAAVGSVLSATSGTWDPEPDAVAFQWLVAGASIPGATEGTYSPTLADLGKKISVQVTATKSGLSPGTASSAETSAVVDPAISNLTPPQVSGDALVGSVLTATEGTWAPNPRQVAYQWLADGVVITGATGSTYTIPTSVVGKKISVLVTATGPGAATASAASVATAKVTTPVIRNLTAPKVTGTAMVDKVLTASPGTWTPSGITFGYQWYVGLKAVTGATQQTFKVPARAVGKQVRFKVTASRPGAKSVSKYSSWTRAVTKASFVFSAPPTLSPETTVGQTVSVLPATLVPDSDTVSYAWYRGTTRILGAAGDSYVLKAADQGRYITVRIKYVRPGYNTATKTLKTAVPIS